MKTCLGKITKKKKIPTIYGHKIRWGAIEGFDIQKTEQAALHVFPEF